MALGCDLKSPDNALGNLYLILKVALLSKWQYDQDTFQFIKRQVQSCIVTVHLFSKCLQINLQIRHLTVLLTLKSPNQKFTFI